MSTFPDKDNPNSDLAQLVTIPVSQILRTKESQTDAPNLSRTNILFFKVRQYLAPLSNHYNLCGALSLIHGVAGFEVQKSAFKVST